MQVVAHQAVSLQWLSYMLLRCILSCNMLEKNTVLTLIFFTWTRIINELLNPFWIVAAVLFYCTLASLCGREMVSDIYWRVTFFRKRGCFLNFVSLNISVALNTGIISSQPETQALKQAEQQLGLLKWLFTTITVNFPMLLPPCAQGQYLDLGFWTMFNLFLILS